MTSVRLSYLQELTPTCSSDVTYVSSCGGLHNSLFCQDANSQNVESLNMSGSEDHQDAPPREVKVIAVDGRCLSVIKLVDVYYTKGTVFEFLRATKLSR